jgi:natural product biosynthesis luciferase-like monooxygenase protein
LLGEQSLVVQCAEILLERRHQIVCIVSADARIAEWAQRRDIPVVGSHEALNTGIPGGEVDYFLSITNQRPLPGWLLRQARRGSINFHDGPLPKYSGTNGPAWALLAGESRYAITWHEMVADRPSLWILLTRELAIPEEETAFGLNAACYAAGLDSFGTVVDLLEQPQLPWVAEVPGAVVFESDMRPKGAAMLDWRAPAVQLARLVRALDFAHVANPMLLPKVDLGVQWFCVREAHVVTGSSSAVAGQILAVSETSFIVRCGEDALEISRATDPYGEPVGIPPLLAAAGFTVGSVLASQDASGDVDTLIHGLARQERAVIADWQAFEPAELPFAARNPHGVRQWIRLEAGPGSTAMHKVASFLLTLARLNGQRHLSVALETATLSTLPPELRRHALGPVSLNISLDGQQTVASWNAAIASAIAHQESVTGAIADLPARDMQARIALRMVRSSPLRLVRCRALPDSLQETDGEALRLYIDDQGRCAAAVDGQRFDETALAKLVSVWTTVEHHARDISALCSRLPLVSSAEMARLDRWSGPALRDGAPPVQRLHELIEAQALTAPHRRACVFEGRALSFAELNATANRMARHLQTLGVARGDIVGVQIPRSIEMVAALIAIHKAGAAYLPLDPTYPAERLAYMAEDARIHVVLSRSDVTHSLPVEHDVKIDRIWASIEALAGGNLGVAGEPSDLAYVMYTSGSTGKPKGVMVEHRNVANFFSGMDDWIGTEPGVWLAITSISFDISVLELFWTLARGFTVVLHGDALRQKGRADNAFLQQAKPVAGDRSRMEFGLFYWNFVSKEADYDAEKYRLLIEGAKFADTHDFSAVWTPERHFESFGGLFPNPSVTSAALATITKNVHLRAGSCVVPLHSPVRIAEEWAVVDNLSNGRVGISIASGWAAPDFVIKPENFANARQVMLDSAVVLRRLWRGEAVELPGPSGPVSVRTLPRPVQQELPLWITAAGNVDTFNQAGKLGAGLLTHLLSQTVEEVALKVAAYRRAWVESGHPGRGNVTLMLHTFVGPDRKKVESIVRQPMKDYLRSAVALLKAAAWQSPTFRKMSTDQKGSLDDFFANASEQDMDDLLEFAFQRYFNNSGLFGSPRDCLSMVERVEAADIDEVGCLIDFGIKTDIVLDHLKYLDEVRVLSHSRAGAAEDYSIAGLLKNEAVTHFQCTPTMAMLLASDADAKPGLSALKHMLVGGEALAPDLVRALSGVVGGQVSNMYGPTETTIWSSSAVANEDAITAANGVSIGVPLRNQTIHVLDENQQQVPPGLPGELVIGGYGVARGYWERPELTAERFLPDPFGQRDAGGRMYRTGDLGRFMADGRIEFLGRRDHQVKIHGYRIELGEIEALLRRETNVAEAVVILREDTPGDRRLVAYVRPADGSTLDPQVSRGNLAAVLPEFMVPAAVVVVAVMPLTPNGKIDRNALPMPRWGERRDAPKSLPAHAPSGANDGIESVVTDIWQRVLGVSGIGARENFFDIGGHSLLIVQVLKELREKFVRPIQMTDLFRHTTIEALVRFLEENPEAGEMSTRGRSRAAARLAARGNRS